MFRISTKKKYQNAQNFKKMADEASCTLSIHDFHRSSTGENGNLMRAIGSLFIRDEHRYCVKSNNWVWRKILCLLLSVMRLGARIETEADTSRYLHQKEFRRDIMAHYSLIQMSQILWRPSNYENSHGSLISSLDVKSLKESSKNTN